MSEPARSDLRRDLELIDAALLETVQRVLAGDTEPADAGDRALCRVVAGRILNTAQALPGALAPVEPVSLRLVGAA